MEDLEVRIYKAGQHIGDGFVTNHQIESGVYSMIRHTLTVIFNPINFSKKQKEPMKTNEVFYMNWMHGSSAPTYQFTNEKDALDEAARLAHRHQATVYTLKALKVSAPKLNVDVEEMKERLLPESTEAN